MACRTIVRGSEDEHSMWYTYNQDIRRRENGYKVLHDIIQMMVNNIRMVYSIVYT